MIRINHMSKSFAGRAIFEDLSLTFDKGYIYVLKGESGSGKTTLLNIIAKLEAYDSGEVDYEGESLRSLSSHRYFRDELGYLFQNLGLLENETIDANLDLAFTGKKMPKAARQSAKEAVLGAVHLEHLALGQKIFELSGGEQQRIALAKLFLKDPPLILVDEPTASLDETNSQAVIDLLLALKNEHRLIIIATHDPQIYKIADKLIDVKDVKSSKS
ncbi:ATP-binding cassette domain-containing protein [Streptococcus sp. zg-JUN1979]|uniref:ATP-binding cassette domain-containing protein n=1 Tax=Streptococcus sp. zg-JUN1979 TaxID=3391450 RepID=UPI0039A43514